jgi:malonyl-CoA O-methyltransferase
VTTPEEFSAYALDTPRVRRSFDRAAATYDDAAVLHREVRDNLLQRLDLMSLAPRVIVDAGAGTGHAARTLIRRYPRSLVIALDASRPMLKAAGRQQSWLRRFTRVCGDAERLPLADGSVNLIVSNLMLQWCDPDAVFAECRRVLAPQGLLNFSTLGPDTLRELRSAWSEVDSHTHVNQFLDMHDIGDALVRAGFESPVLDVERYTLSYLDVRRVAADLKATGAHNATLGRSRGLTGRRRFNALTAAYESFRRDGRLPATYEVVFGHAWASGPSSRRGGLDESAAPDTLVSIEDLKHQLPSRRRP